MAEGKYFYEYILERVCIWNVATGKKIQILPEQVKPIGFTQDDRYLAVQQGGHQIRFWDIQNELWHDSYTFDGVITSAQMTDNDTVVALEKRGKSDEFTDWYIHQITLD